VKESSRFLIPVHEWRGLDAAARQDLLRRAPQNRSPELWQQISAIVEAVREEGDAAVARYAARFDNLQQDSFRVGEPALVDAANKLDSSTAGALEIACRNLVTFHEKGRPRGYEAETVPGVVCRAGFRPIERVGLYAPGGSTPLPSTVLMMGVPSQIAGCRTRVLCCPPSPDGRLDPGIAFAARLVGISDVFLIGGAHAIAAMAFGTATVPACDKLFGPGSARVTAAKQLVTQLAPVTIDMPAGPSEVLVIADGQANAEFIAADMLAQLEHGPDSQALLVTWSRALANRVADAVAAQAAVLPRSEMVGNSIAYSAILVVEDPAEAVAIANQYAAEHLIINTDDPEDLFSKIDSAGSVFLGPWTPEVLGDYCSGTNHVLPTNGTARSLGGLSVADFMKRITVQHATRQGFERLAPVARRIAEHEGLTAHAMAATIRERSARVGAKDCAEDDAKGGVSP
jgi:histidinol dehydrogenase